MVIPYSPLPSITTKILLAPLLPVILKHKRREFATHALVDSGAAGAVISTIIAEHLGIHWRRIPVSYGYSVSGTFRAHKFEKLQASVFDNNFPFIVNIIEGIGPHDCIFGQADLFQRAKITFEAYKNQFEIIFREYN